MAPTWCCLAGYLVQPANHSNHGSSAPAGPTVTHAEILRAKCTSHSSMSCVIWAQDACVDPSCTVMSNIAASSWQTTCVCMHVCCVRRCEPTMSRVMSLLSSPGAVCIMPGHHMGGGICERRAPCNSIRYDTISSSVSFLPSNILVFYACTFELVQLRLHTCKE